MMILAVAMRWSCCYLGQEKGGKAPGSGSVKEKEGEIDDT